MERHPLYDLLFVLVLSVIVNGEENTDTVACKENQKAFNGSCYEFVTMQRSFFSAQAGCERGGGHLAFIRNKATQQFLQKHLQSDHNWWLGLASASLSLSSPSSKDPLSWLDGSEVSYSNWLREDLPGAGCGYISAKSDFQWEATSNCSQEFFFICEFETTQSLACLDNHAMLKCEFGQVIEIDQSFYGRNTPHYCTAGHYLSHTVSVQDRCSWVNVVSVVSDICNGHRVCEVPADAPAFGEPCPQLGSYLSIKYHCTDAKNGAESSSQLKRYSRDDTVCTCKDLHDAHSGDVKIKCKENCNDRVDVNVNVKLEADPSENVQWYYQVSDTTANSVQFPCNKNNDPVRFIHLTNVLKTDKDFTIDKSVLASLSQDLVVVTKGKKDNKEGFGCHDIKKPTATTTTEYPTTSNEPSTTSTAQPDPALDCSISPSSGNVLTQFKITCTINLNFCFGLCSFYVTTSTGKYVHWGNQLIMPNLYLPLNTKELIVTVKNTAGRKKSTSLKVNVNNANSNTDPGAVQNAVAQALALQKQGALSAPQMAQLFKAISEQISNSSNAKALVEDMSKSLCEAVNNTNFNQDDIDLISSTTLSLVMNEDHLTPAAKTASCCILDGISKQISLLDGDGHKTAVSAASFIVSSVSSLLKRSANSDQQLSESLLNVMNQVQSSLLANRSINSEPLILSSPLVNMSVQRVTADNIKPSNPISAGASSAAFSLPSSVSRLIPSNEPVNLRMMSFKINPYGWSNDGDISGAIGSLSLTKDDGSGISVAGLSEEIEILLPRLDAAALNKTLLNLTSYSTMAINITAPNNSLVVKLEPSDGSSLILNLGFEYYPNDTNYVAKIQLPLTDVSEDAKYTWVLTPKNVTLEVGVYYLLVRPIVPPGVKSSNTFVSITSVTATCKYWNETKKSWGEHGCRVGPGTSLQVTQCLCTHLTSFGSSFFVMPNTVDVSRTAELFSTFANNPVVVCFVGAIFLAYFITVIWARKKDLQDKIKVRITVLEDTEPLAEYRYLVAVTTGHRHGAATTSNVTLTLQGTVWESKPHHLTDPEKPVFTRGAADIFMLTTPFSLGDLQSIRLWHDNSGEQPDWYVSKVMVQDLETGQVWNFLCNSWLAIDIGDCTLDKVFSIASEKDLKGFRNLFFTKTAKDLCDGHIWYSVLNRPATSNFTRVQRLSCCFSLLLCTMLTSIMFWGVPTSPTEQDMELGAIKFNVQQFMIGIQSSIIMFPVNLLIVTIFRSTRPRKKKDIAIMQTSKSGSPKQEKKLAEKWRIETDITIEIVVQELKKIVRSLSKAVRCPVPNSAEESETTDISTLLIVLEDIVRQQNFTLNKFYVDNPENDPFLVYKLYRPYLYKQIRNLEKEMRLLGSSQFPKPMEFIQATMQVRGIKQLLEPYLYDNPIGNSEVIAGHQEEKKKWYQKGLPWWFVFVGWLLVAATSGVSAYYTMMYGLTYGKERSVSWLISISVSFFESLFVTQPIKVLGLAIFFALVVKNIKSDDENYFLLLKELTLTYSEDPDDIRVSRRDSTCRIYQPPPPADIEKMKENNIKNQKAIALIKEIIIYLAFLCVLLVATYGQRDPNAYYLTQHIQQSFSNGITDSMRAGDVFTWANTVLIKNLYGPRTGFITDGNSKLVGSARLRQIRMHRNSCKIPKAMRDAIPDCHSPYSWGLEDMGSYGPGWNRSRDENMTMSLLIPWQYQTQSKLRGHPIWGNMAFYRGGGFVLDLGVDPEEASSMIQYLFDNTWLDVFTRAIFVEFTVYNANVNLFCVVTLMFETNALGAFQYTSELHNLKIYQTTEGVNVVASEVIYFLFILYYMVLQVRRIKQQKWQYFRIKYNLLELSIILLSLAAIGAIINRTVQGNKDLNYFQKHKDEFPSFYDTASADACLGYILAFLILLGTIKMWHLMRLNSKLNLITCTLQRAWKDISSFIVVLVIMVLAYSVVSNLLFGWILYTYKTLQDSMLAIIALQLGVFNYEEVLNLNPVIGSFLILSCVIFLTFVVLNLFIAVILEAFSHEQRNYKPSEEEEIVDLMMFKICKTFGIPVKKK